MQRFLAITRNLNIQTRLVLYYITFAVITVAIVTYFAYTQTIQSLQATVEDKLGAVAELKRDSLSQWMDEQQSNAVFLANLPELRSLSTDLLAPESPPQDRDMARREFYRIFNITLQRTAEIQDIQILDLEGHIVISRDPALVGRSQSEQAFFFEGRSQTFTQTFYDSELFGHTTLTIATPLLDNSQQRIGVLALHFSMKRVDRLIHHEGQGAVSQSVKTYLVDSGYNVITDDPFILARAAELRTSAIALARQPGTGTSSYVNHNGVEVIGKYLWIEDQNAALIVEIDRETALQPARQLAVNIGIVGIQISVILIIAVIIMAQQITAPLRALSETVVRMTDGRLNVSAPVLGSDEVGTLARAFNSMTEKLRRTVDGLQTELSERRQAESDLLQFRTVMDESNDAIYLIDPETSRCIDFNKSAYEILGYSHEELVRLGIIDIAEYVTSLEDWHDRIELIYQTSSLIFETVYRRKDYTTFPVEVSARMLYYGGRTLLLFVVRDITQRKQSEKALRDSEERFRKVFQSSPLAISITTLEDGRLLDANYAYWDLTGYAADQALGRNAKELKLWKDIRARAEYVEDLKHKGSLFNPDDQFYHPDGTLKYVISFHELIQIGHEDCVLSMFYDMSAQKQTMQALQQSEARNRAMVDAFPDMIMEFALDGVIVNMVPPKGLERVMSADQFIGKRVDDLFTETVADAMLLAVQRVIATNQIEVFEFEIMMGAQPRVMEARLTASASDTVLAMIRDFTQRKWVEQEREKLISELEAKNRESETLRESVAIVAATLERSEAIDRILEQLERVVPFDSASVQLISGNARNRQRPRR